MHSSKTRPESKYEPKDGLATFVCATANSCERSRSQHNRRDAKLLANPERYGVNDGTVCATE